MDWIALGLIQVNAAPAHLSCRRRPPFTYFLLPCSDPIATRSFVLWMHGLGDSGWATPDGLTSPFRTFFSVPELKLAKRSCFLLCSSICLYAFVMQINGKGHFVLMHWTNFVMGFRLWSISVFSIRLPLFFRVASTEKKQLFCMQNVASSPILGLASCLSTSDWMFATIQLY